MNTNLIELRSSYQRQIDAVDLLLGTARRGYTTNGHRTMSGRRGWSQAAKDKLARIARARWRKARKAGLSHL